MRELLQAKLGLLAVGIGIGLLHLPISLALNVTLNGQGTMARSIVLLLYPVAVAVTGLGAVLAMRHPRLARPGALRVAGTAILAYLAASLWFNFTTDVPLHVLISIVLHFGTIALWYLFLGAAQTGMLAVVRRVDAAQMGPAWGWHLAGLFVGYLFSEGATETFGASAVLLSCGVGLLLSPRWVVPAMLALLVAGLPLQLEETIERTRVIEGSIRAELDQQSRQGEPQQPLRDAASITDFEHVDWSRFGQFRVHRWSHERTGVLYNLKPQYNLPRLESGPDDQSRRFRMALYQSIPVTDSVALIATGGGRSLYFFPEEQLSRITAVERDPSAARYFGETHTASNSHLYTKTNFINADGRAAMETSTETFDTMVFESSIYQPTHTMLPMATPFFYLTQEAIDAYLDKLKPGGLIAFEIRGASMVTQRDAGGSLERREYLPTHILTHLRHSGLRTEAVRCERVTYLLASTDDARLSGAIVALQSAGPVAQGLHETMTKNRTSIALTDDSPFANWHALSGKRRKIYLVIAGVLAGLGLLIGAAIGFFRRKEAGWRATPWFWILGYFHAALQFHTFHLWRTYFGDSLITVWWLIIINFALGAIASGLAPRVAPWLHSRVVRLGSTVVLLALHFAACWALPFHEPSLWLRLAFGLVALVPSSILLGVWMPLGLRSASSRGLGSWLAADAIGTLVAASTLFLIMIPLGGMAYGATVVASGLLVAALWTPPAT